MSSVAREFLEREVSSLENLRAEHFPDEPPPTWLTLLRHVLDLRDERLMNLMAKSLLEEQVAKGEIEIDRAQRFPGHRPLDDQLSEKEIGELRDEITKCQQLLKRLE